MLEKPVPPLFESSYQSLVIFFRLRAEEMTEELMEVEELTEEMAEETEFSGGGKPVKVITESVERKSTVESTSSTDWDTNTSG